MLLFNHAKFIKKQFFVGFMDYEKTYDFANRGIIIKDLIKKGCGKNFTNAIDKMYMNSEYITVERNRLGEVINTTYGVTQGRKSSTHIYS